MKLPGSTLTPWKNQMLPNKINTHPTIFDAILKFPLQEVIAPEWRGQPYSPRRSFRGSLAYHIKTSHPSARRARRRANRIGKEKLVKRTSASR
jgi:hypothetical protein